MYIFSSIIIILILISSYPESIIYIIGTAFFTGLFCKIPDYFSLPEKNKEEDTNLFNHLPDHITYKEKEEESLKECTLNNNIKEDPEVIKIQQSLKQHIDKVQAQEQEKLDALIQSDRQHAENNPY